MPKEHVNPPALFESRSHGFSQAVIAAGGRTIYLSGQVAWDAQRRLVGGGDLGAQARQAFRNLTAALQACGAGMSDVVSLRLYIVGPVPEKAAVVGEALREAFAGLPPPAATWIGVASLANAGFLIEVEATAVVE